MNELINYLQNLWQNAVVPTIKSSLTKSKENSDMIVDAIKNKENIKEISINNPDDISIPIIEAQDKTTKAIENIEPIKLETLETRLDNIKTSIDEKDLSVNVETDLKPVSISLENVKKELTKILKAIPTKLSTKVIETSLESILSELESKEPTDISKVEKLLSDVKTSIDSLDLNIVFPEFPDFEEVLKKYIENGRIKVQVDRAGGGGGGLTQIESEKLQTLATEDKQSPLGGYVPAGMDIVSNPYYFGYLKTDGSWYIKKLDTQSGTTYYKGTNNYSTNWTNRSSLSFGEFDEIFGS